MGTTVEKNTQLGGVIAWLTVFVSILTSFVVLPQLIDRSLARSTRLVRLSESHCLEMRLQFQWFHPLVFRCEILTFLDKFGKESLSPSGKVFFAPQVSSATAIDSQRFALNFFAGGTRNHSIFDITNVGAQSAILDGFLLDVSEGGDLLLYGENTLAFRDRESGAITDQIQLDNWPQSICYAHKVLLPSDFSQEVTVIRVVDAHLWTSRCRYSNATASETIEAVALSNNQLFIVGRQNIIAVDLDSCAIYRESMLPEATQFNFRGSDFIRLSGGDTLISNARVMRLQIPMKPVTASDKEILQFLAIGDELRIKSAKNGSYTAFLFIYFALITSFISVFRFYKFVSSAVFFSSLWMQLAMLLLVMNFGEIWKAPSILLIVPSFTLILWAQQTLSSQWLPKLANLAFLLWSFVCLSTFEGCFESLPVITMVTIWIFRLRLTARTSGFFQFSVFECILFTFAIAILVAVLDPIYGIAYSTVVASILIGIFLELLFMFAVRRKRGAGATGTAEWKIPEDVDSL